jgi:D-glycero-alpha-D-manno-heptose 1-phosphate guanylyltransferase
MTNEAIILAGGFGTRLKEVVQDVPKPMAPVNGRPFLEYLLKYLSHYKIKKVILSVGYLADTIVSHFGNRFEEMEISYSVENDPLGTGGGIRLAMEKSQSTNVLVLNGDSFFDINLDDFYEAHRNAQSDCSLALRKVQNASRYGTIRLDPDSRIKEFSEKNGLSQQGIINAGAYLLKRELFLEKTSANKNFSIERDFFESRLDELNIFGFTYEGYFIDIGIPDDYKKAQHDFAQFRY